MKVFKRILVIFLCVCLLTPTISYRVNAVEIGAGFVLTAKTVFDICLFVGGVVVVGYAAGEVIDNQEEIARAGKEFIDSIKEIPEGWILNMTDSSGQQYVFGSEALELVQDTPWEVIQGGGPGNDNNNDDNNDDDKKKGFLISSARSVSLSVVLLLLVLHGLLMPLLVFIRNG